jgi:hypothetical protein
MQAVTSVTFTRPFVPAANSSYPINDTGANAVLFAAGWWTANLESEVATSAQLAGEPSPPSLPPSPDSQEENADALEQMSTKRERRLRYAQTISDQLRNCTVHPLELD